MLMFVVPTPSTKLALEFGAYQIKAHHKTYIMNRLSGLNIVFEFQHLTKCGYQLN